MKNLTSYQINTVKEAEKLDNVVGNLIEIIEDLANQVATWEGVAKIVDCNTPDELEAKLIEIS